MSLKDEIRDCKKCPLCNLMDTSPIPPEWKGNPNIMFIMDVKVNMIHDYEQSILSGATRIRFIHLIEKYFDSWYITPLVKCKPKAASYNNTNYEICTSWIKEEISRMCPKIVIGCGPKVSKYIDCDYETMTAHRITQGKNNEKMFEDLLIKVKEEINANKPQ